MVDNDIYFHRSVFLWTFMVYDIFHGVKARGLYLHFDSIALRTLSLLPINLLHLFYLSPAYISQICLFNVFYKFCIQFFTWHLNAQLEAFKTVVYQRKHVLFHCEVAFRDPADSKQEYKQYLPDFILCKLICKKIHSDPVYFLKLIQI